MTSCLESIRNKIQTNGNFRIAFVGDSLTSCEWVHPNWREIVEYVVKEELQKMMADWKVPSWGIKCFNFGFDGATTKDILDKSGEIGEMKPDLIISLMGGNDPTFGIGPEETRMSIEKIMDEFKGINVFWMTSLPDLRERKNTEYEDYRIATLKVGCHENQEIFDMFEEYKKNDLNMMYTLKTDEYQSENYQIDPTHPSQLGNAYIAKVVLEKIGGINFDPEKYIETNEKSYKFPEY